MSRHGGKVRLGKKKYTVLRNIASVDGNYDEYGEVIEGGWETIEIMANIQGALVYNKMRMTNAGDVSKTLFLLDQIKTCTKLELM